MSVSDFRTRLTKFTGAVDPKQAPPYWPIYNNPEVGGKKKYPNAGIRVPSPLTLFNFYMNPSFIDGDRTKPLILPFVSQPIKNGPGLPQHVVDMVQQFNNCTKSPPVNCTMSDWYGPIKKAFDMSYQEYSANCKPLLSFLAPPISDEAYLRFVHGWVPFRVDPPNGSPCTPAKVPDLPQTSDPPSLLGQAPVYYMQLQYNFEAPFNASGKQVFNAYTQLIHGKLEDGNLDSAAYAFSIDDHESVQNYSGYGLIFAVGGGKGLPNQTKIPRAVPQHYDWYTARVQLGIDKTKPVKYKSYGVCSQVA